MEIDKSSLNVNIGQREKRERSGQVSNQFTPRKFQRINQLDQEEEDDETEEKETNAAEDEDESTDEIASIFLDN